MKDGDREVAYSSGGRIFLRVGCKLSSQAKVDGAHTVDSWVRGPHDREDMSHGAEVLLHALFVDWLVVCCENVCADLVSKDLKEWDLVIDFLEVVWDVQPCVEGVLLFPHCAVLAQS